MYLLILLILNNLNDIQSFIIPELPHRLVLGGASSNTFQPKRTHPTTTTLYGTNRKARRLQQKQQKKDRGTGLTTPLPEDTEVKPTKIAGTSPAALLEERPGARDDTADKPEVSTVVIDETTGMEKIAQGKAVMDVLTRKAVVLSSLGPEYRLAQMFPGVDPGTREALRMRDFYAPNKKVSEMVEALRAACLITDETTGETVLPPHPSLSQKGIDFVLANRDFLGFRMKKTLGRLKLRAQSLGNLDEARSLRALWKHYLTLEDHISAPFRQIVLDAESLVGPNFGNLDLKSYIGKELYERCGTYIVLKGMVCHWEKKLRDAEVVEGTPESKDTFYRTLCTGDPKRYLPQPPIIFRKKEVERVTAMAQLMTKTFVDDETLFADLPVELRFIEQALSVKGGTALRKFMVEFCDEEGITPEALREGMRRFDQQLDTMQIDPYGDFKNIVGRLSEAMAVGSDEQVDPYAEYLYNAKKDGPGYFQTYTFSHHKNSMVRFLDNARTIEKEGVGPMNDVVGQLSNDLTTMFGTPTGAVSSDKVEKIGDDGEYYRPPAKRALGRPHEMGWLELLDDEVPKSENDEMFESDNWREIRLSLIHI